MIKNLLSFTLLSAFTGNSFGQDLHRAYFPNSTTFVDYPGSLKQSEIISTTPTLLFSVNIENEDGSSPAFPQFWLSHLQRFTSLEEYLDNFIKNNDHPGSVSPEKTVINGYPAIKVSYDTTFHFDFSGGRYADSAISTYLFAININNEIYECSILSPSPDNLSEYLQTLESLCGSIEIQ